MATQKESLSVEALAKAIETTLALAKKNGEQLTINAVANKIREKFTFSKDKWSAARKMLAQKTNKSDATKPCATKPAHKGKTCDKLCACKENHADQSPADLFYDSIDSAYDMVEDAVAHFFSKLVEAYSPDKSVSGEVSVSGPLEPIIQETLDLAVAAGLLKRSIRYSLGDKVIDKLSASKSTKKPSAKKTK